MVCFSLIFQQHVKKEKFCFGRKREALKLIHIIILRTSLYYLTIFEITIANQLVSYKKGGSV